MQIRVLTKNKQNQNKIKQSRKKRTLLLHLSCLSISSSFVVVLGASAYHQYKLFSIQLYLQMFIV